MRFKGVMFDLDGTLLNTIDDLADCMNNILSVRGFPVYNTEEYKMLVGGGTENLIENVIPEDERTEDNIRIITGELLSSYKDRCLNKTRPYDGVSEILDKLTEKKVKMSIYSNKNDDLTKLMVKELLPHWEFFDVVGAKPDKPRKPDCSVALEIVERMEMNPDEILYLGDSDLDMITAISAGMYPVGALWGFRSAEELLNSGAKKLIKHPLELLKIINC